MNCRRNAHNVNKIKVTHKRKHINERSQITRNDVQQTWHWLTVCTCLWSHHRSHVMTSSKPDTGSQFVPACDLTTNQHFYSVLTTLLRPFNVVDCGTNWKDFLLVINSNHLPHLTPFLRYGDLLAESCQFSLVHLVRVTTVKFLEKPYRSCN